MTPRDRLLKGALEQALSDRGASSDEGCTALANALISALVRVRQNPHTSLPCAVEMRRLADRLTRLADEPLATVADLAVALSDDRVLQ